MCTDIKHSATDTSPRRKLLFCWRKSVHIHGSLEFIVRGNPPFSVSENPLNTLAARLDLMSIKTVIKYLDFPTRKVESLITNRLPSKFEPVFVGWISGDTHYVEVFATFPNGSSCQNYVQKNQPSYDESSSC